MKDVVTTIKFFESTVTCVDAPQLMQKLESMLSSAPFTLTNKRCWPARECSGGPFSDLLSSNQQQEVREHAIIMVVALW